MWQVSFIIKIILIEIKVTVEILVLGLINSQAGRPLHVIASNDNQTTTVDDANRYQLSTFHTPFFFLYFAILRISYLLLMTSKGAGLLKSYNY